MGSLTRANLRHCARYSKAWSCLYCTHVIQGGIEDYYITFVLGQETHYFTKVCRSCTSVCSKIYGFINIGSYIKWLFFLYFILVYLCSNLFILCDVTTKVLEQIIVHAMRTGKKNLLQVVLNYFYVHDVDIYFNLNLIYVSHYLGNNILQHLGVICRLQMGRKRKIVDSGWGYILKQTETNFWVRSFSHYNESK